MTTRTRPIAIQRHVASRKCKVKLSRAFMMWSGKVQATRRAISDAVDNTAYIIGVLCVTLVFAPVILLAWLAVGLDRLERRDLQAMTRNQT
jgi:hypothetical protein